MWIIYDMRVNGLWYAEHLFVDYEEESCWKLCLSSKRNGGYKLKIRQTDGLFEPKQESGFRLSETNKTALKVFVCEAKRRLDKLKLIE